MNFSIKVKNCPGYVLLMLDGEATATHIHTLSKKLEPLTKKKVEKIVVDLSKVKYIDSHGLGIFVYAWKTMESNNKELVFYNPQSFIRDMFQATNLDKLLRIINNLEELWVSPSPNQI